MNKESRTTVNWLERVCTDCSDDLIVDGDESAEYGLLKIGKTACNSTSKSRCDRSRYIPEDRNGESFESLLKSKIFEPLRMSNSSLFGPRDTINGVISGNLKERNKLIWPLRLGAQSIFSTVSDLSRVGNAILSSTLISPAQTRCWDKPVSHTSNPANSVGHPWVIYWGGQYPQTAVVYVNTVLGTIVGFTILAADETGSPDPNALADIIADVVFPALMQLAPMQAMESFGGKYEQESSKSSITIAGKLCGVQDPSAVSIRMFPTDLETKTRSGSRMAFRGVIQDMNEEADNGMPTCESWMDALAKPPSLPPPPPPSILVKKFLSKG
ncbi:beta-lactamase [Histoplasma capsulatum var. duboisii H88]|uniref:Beta-lactamase n=1 Tax=Ajellomyces capsulatus (strain H88) TaxID=544711 RepID=F0UMY2_AJEC8|nr:beta-lactamase [Histoplasma capsulatum var. duboisii H88]